MNKVILLLAFVSAIFAQKPIPCTSPPQWEGRLFEYDDDKQFMLRGHIAYDSIYRRERVIEEQILGSDREAFDSLYLYNTQIQYVFNLNTRQCQKQPLTRPWRPIGISPNATSFGESYIGSSAVPNANLLTTIWGGNFTDDRGNQVQYFSSWTLEGCIPVSATFISPGFGALHEFFFDITPGIQDPNEFIPRPECLNL